jgi:hypothetical protein
MVLIKRLPRDSAFVQAVSVAARWSTTDYLIANLIDAQTRTKPDDPRFPRPAEQEQQRLDAADRAARLERQAARVRRQREGET